MSSPSYEMFFCNAAFNEVADVINTFAELRQLNNHTCWTYPPGNEQFDMLIERDDEEWDEFVQDEVDIELFLSVFNDRKPSCSLYLEGRKWAGARGVQMIRKTAITLLERFDGLFATEEQLFTLADLENASRIPCGKVVDYRAIEKTDIPLTRKRIALGIREALQDQYFIDPCFEIGDDCTRKVLTDEIVSIGEMAIPVITPWLTSENKGLVIAGVEIINRINR